MEAKAITAMVCLSEGMTLTIHIFQMKLFNAIAAAAVIGASLIAATPAEARNGWEYVHQTSEGNPLYIKLMSRSGSIWSVKHREPGYSDWVTKTDCSTYMYKLNNGQWREIMPGSVGAFIYRKLC